MDITNETLKVIGQPESEQLEYKAVLPPSRSLGQMISAFANTTGGLIILGVAESPNGPIINGLSEDFHANSVTHKAIDLLSPKPNVYYQYITHKNKRLYVIKVEQSDAPITLEGKIYMRIGPSIILKDPVKKEFKSGGYRRVEQLTKQLELYRKSSTGAKSKFIDHYQSVLNIINDLGIILYPDSPTVPTKNQEGKILIRILFSSCADNFETYLSDLLYEIYLANPSTLKSNQQVSIKEVLDCVDMQEFVVYWAKKKLNRLQRGSVKNFITDNSQINDLGVLDVTAQENIEKILQIRHLYAHRNGIIDEKFLQFYPGQFNLNEEHRLTIEELLNHFVYLSDCVYQIDAAAVLKYTLATFD